MSLVAKTFRAAARVPAVRRSLVVRSMSTDAFKERDRAAEAAFFNAADAQALAALTAKLRKANQMHPNKAVASVVKTEMDDLRAIIAPHNLPHEKLQGKRVTASSGLMIEALWS
jgi:hypothetical protein